MLTQIQLKQHLYYDPLNGIFTWKQQGSGRFRVKAGNLDVTRNSKIRIWLLGRFYTAAELAWLYVYGEFPIRSLDHINCDASDNSIANLRLATTVQNMQNRRRYRNNTSGFKGVSKIGRRWRAIIKDGPKNRHLGCFPTPELAYAAYKQAAQQSFGEFARLE